MSGKNFPKTALVLSIIIAFSSRALAGIVSFEAYPGTPPAPQAVTFAQSDPRFDTAVSIWVRRGADWTRGSGTVVGSNKVDTVGHLFAAAWDEIRVYTGHDIGSFQQLTYGSSVEFYDGWNPSLPLHLANDGATLYTSDPMVGITPAVPYLGPIPVGTQAEIVGYGSYGYVGAGPLGIDFHRRAGTTRIDYIDIFSGTESFTSLFRAPDDALSFPLTMRGSYGVSGGSIWGFIEDEWRFIGHEFASDTIYGYGSATYSIRVVPEPTALTLLALLATGLLLVVRKRPQRRGKSIVNEAYAGVSVLI